MENMKKRHEPEEVTESEYPYGLKITLQSDELYKLGIDVGDCYVGERVTVNAEGEIVGVSKEGDEKCLTIQITDILVDKAQRTVKDAANFAAYKMANK